MKNQSPTFSDAWYRVAKLTPRLPVAVRVHRQYFRGMKWYVLQDPMSNEFFRLSDTAYYFIAMLNGEHTVEQVWHACLETFGDDAPTQGEVIAVLGQLYLANLLQADMTPDAEALFRRYYRRKRREVQGVVSNFLFIRIPLWDPDRFLDRWVGLCGWLFSGYGLALWSAIVGAGLWAVFGHMGELTRNAAGVLNPENIPLLYGVLVALKALHEMGHAMACKYFGKQEGTGGEVHQMGITFLFFTPLPFVDASSAWAFRSKVHRMVVGASGMMVELAVAALAAFLWTQTAEGSLLHAVAYNLMFVASVSTVLFNGNPFLRYDAYYMLSDLIEIPNLDSRSKLYVRYGLKRHMWGVENARDPSHATREKGWLVFYAVASIACRMMVMALIVITICNSFFLAGMILAPILVFTWVMVPVGKLLGYLAISPEIERNRLRAVLTTLSVAAALVTSIGLVNWPDRCRIEGVVEPVSLAAVYMETAGFVSAVLDSGTLADPKGPPLIQAANPDVETQQASLEAQMRELQIRRQEARTREAASAQILDEEIGAVSEQIARNNQRLQGLKLAAPVLGTWVAPNIDRKIGRYLKRGDLIGMVASLDTLRFRAVAGQTTAAQLIKESRPLVDIRVKGRPDIAQTGRVEIILPAGQEELPSAALGYAAGGSTRVDQQDPSGRLAAEPFFEIRVMPMDGKLSRMRPGQRVVLRFETSPKPLLVQVWRQLLQVFQPRFKV